MIWWILGGIVLIVLVLVVAATASETPPKRHAAYGSGFPGEVLWGFVTLYRPKYHAEVRRIDDTTGTFRIWRGSGEISSRTVAVPRPGEPYDAHKDAWAREFEKFLFSIGHG